MTRKALMFLVILGIAGLLLTGCLKTEEPVQQVQSSEAEQDSNAPEIVIKIGFGGPETLPNYRAIKELFKPEIESRTNGRIKVELYPSSQLGDDVKLIESLRSGTLEAAGPTTAPLVGMAPEFAVFDIPFLFESGEVADQILDGEIGSKLNKLLESKGLYNLAWTEMGFRHVTNSVHPITSPSDIKGLKIRTMENPIHLEAWRLLGANPTPMPVSEVFTALQQHAIDGQENPVVAIYGWKFYEVNNYISLTGHVYSPLTFLYSKKLFDSYSPDDQKLIREVALKTGIRGREIARADESSYLEEIKEAGATIVELTAAQKQAFQEVTQPVWDSVAEKVGDELIEELKTELAKVTR